MILFQNEKNPFINKNKNKNIELNGTKDGDDLRFL